MTMHPVQIEPMTGADWDYLEKLVQWREIHLRMEREHFSALGGLSIVADDEYRLCCEVEIKLARFRKEAEAV